jgi:hypothetical protein
MRMIIRVMPADGRNSVRLPAVASAWSGMINYINVLQDLKLTVGDDLDQGWRELPCPSCRVSIDPYWFAEAVETQSAFAHVSRMIVMPCCSSELSVNAVCGREKRRLAGFVLSFHSLGREMDTKVIRQLEQVLDCPLHRYFDMEVGE